MFLKSSFFFFLVSLQVLKFLITVAFPRFQIRHLTKVQMLYLAVDLCSGGSVGSLSRPGWAAQCSCTRSSRHLVSVTWTDSKVTSSTLMESHKLVCKCVTHPGFVNRGGRILILQEYPETRQISHKNGEKNVLWKMH